MNSVTLRWIGGVLAALGLAAPLLRAQGPPAAPATGYEAFRLVRLRNIFDPDRRGLRGDGAAAPTAALHPSGPLPNYIALTGAMVTAGRKLAFFSGARPEYSKVLRPHDAIADFTVADITSSQVELRLNGKPVVVSVGQNVPLAGSSAAKLPGLQSAPEAAPLPPPSPVAAGAIPPSAPGGPPPAAAAAVAPPPTPGGSEEVLRRMMERRQKELAK